MIPPIVTPKEHGAWAVLFVPMLAAAILTQSVNFPYALLICSTLMFFMSYVPLHTIFRHYADKAVREAPYWRAKFWAVTYLTLAGLFILPVLFRGYVSLVPIGLLASSALAANFFLSENAPRTIPGDLVAVFGLTLSGPAAYYVLKGRFDQTALVLWVSNLLFFGYCVFYVHLNIKAVAAKKAAFSLREKFRMSRHIIIYNAVVISVLCYFMLDKLTPEYSFIAFVPIVGQTLWGTMKLSGKVRFKNLGFLLLGHSLLFGLLMGILE